MEGTARRLFVDESKVSTELVHGEATVTQWAERIVAPANVALEQASRLSIGFLSLIWIALVGVADYWTGPEYSMLIFYLVPVTLGTWFCGRKFGMLLAVLSITTSSVSDLVAGLPDVRYWNEAVGLGSYVVFVALLSRWRSLLQQLDQRVRLRTAALQEEVLERMRLQKEMTELTERERRRLGHDLHDSLCQHLTGTALAAQSLCDKLASASSAGTTNAERVVRLIEEGIDLTRNLSRGLFSPDLDSGGLVAALSALADNARERFGVGCEFHHQTKTREEPPSAVSTQLYRIAQEAVANAGKHSRCSRIVIELDRENDEVNLNVFDDGKGFAATEGRGLGLRMMQHGAEVIGGQLSVVADLRGTTVSCTVKKTPLRRFYES